MTILEKRSAVRVQALRNLVNKNEYSAEYAIVKLDELNQSGLLIASDYEECFEHLSNLMQAENVVEEQVGEIPEENIESSDEVVETFEPTIEETKDESEE